MKGLLDGKQEQLTSAEGSRKGLAGSKEGPRCLQLIEIRSRSQKFRAATVDDGRRSRQTFRIMRVLL